MIKKIDILIGKNPYQSTSCFARALGRAFREEGVDVRLLWLKEGCYYDVIDALNAHPPDLTCSFSDLTFGNHRPFAEALQIPHLSLLIDPAIYFLHQLESPLSIVSCVDEEDSSFLTHLGSKHHFFLPHGVDKEWGEEKRREKRFDVVFIGTIEDETKRRRLWREKFSKEERCLLEESAEEVLCSTDLSIKGALLKREVKKEKFILYHHELDAYVTACERKTLLEALKGLKIDIWGKGPWKRVAPFASCHRALPFKKVKEVYLEAKIVLNPSPRFAFGSHERLFMVPLLGAMVATRASSYLNKAFPKGISPLIYHPRALEGFKEECGTLLRKGLEEVVEGLKEHVLRHHTWNHRACHILKEVNEMLSDSKSHFSRAPFNI